MKIVGAIDCFRDNEESRHLRRHSHKKSEYFLRRQLKLWAREQEFVFLDHLTPHAIDEYAFDRVTTLTIVTISPTEAIVGTTRSVVISMRLPADSANRLKRLATRHGWTPSDASARLVEEGLRRAEFAFSDFRDSTAGRQAYIQGSTLAGGKQCCWFAVTKEMLPRSRSIFNGQKPGSKQP